MSFRDRSIIREKFHVSLKDFKVIKKLSSGGFGKVFLVEDTNTKKKFAAKVLQSEEDEQSRKMINREIGILMLLQHPTFVKFYGYSLQDFEGHNNVTIIMSLAQNGSLAAFLQNVKRGLSDISYDNTMRQKILIGIARAMMYLHQNHIIHRDLKPENVLLDEFYNPHLTDFGLSKIYEIGRSQNQTQAYGTSIYMAPEVIKGDKYNGKADVYSFAILMFEVVTDLTPYPLFQSKKMSLFQFNNKVVNEKYRPEFTVPVKESIRALIVQCWSDNPSERPTFSEIFKKLAFNLEESVYDVFENDEEYKFYLDNVDVDDVLSYAYDITENERNISSSSSEIQELKQKNEELSMKNKQIEDELKSQKELIQKVSKDNKQLLAENKKMRDEINQLFELVRNLSKKEETKTKATRSVRCSTKPVKSYNYKEKFNGIMNSLIKEFGKEIIKISSNSIDDQDPKSLVNYKHPGYYLSKDEKDIYILFEFKNKSIQLTSYEIQTGNGSKNRSHLKNWKIQVSNDKNEWVTIDTHENDPVLNGTEKIAKFDVQIITQNFYQFVRILSTGDSWNIFDNHKRICLKCVEFYGNVR